MKSGIATKLRNVLAKLYPDEASMRRISHDGGLDLSRVMLNSSATNNWHSILIEAEKLDRINVLLDKVKDEYGSNHEFLDIYNTYQIHWTRLGIEFIDDLNKDLQSEQKKQEALAKKQDPNSRPDPEIQSKINRLHQKIIEVEHFDWYKAEQAYLDKVIKLYDRVRILGSSSDIPLGNLFTQVYILDKPTARYRHDIEELRKRGAERNEFQRQPGERVHGLDLVKTGRNLFILGKPGAGKTTFLKYITIQAAHKQLPRVPIFVSLNQWADSRWGKGDKAALLPFLIEQFDICDFPDADLFLDYLLRIGRALVLFDGLDEVKQEKDQRRRLTRLLQDFARKYDKSQHLITCRIAASEYAFAGFADVEVADFTPDQVREYTHNWFGVKDKKFDAFTIELDKPENKGIAELCNSPLLLSLLCLTFDNTIRFPLNRAELYEDALDTLLRKWDSSRQIQRDDIYRDLSHKRKLHLLMNIAVPAFQKGELFFHQRDLEKWIVNYLAKLPGAPAADTLDGTPLLKAMEAQHSILVERAQGIYSFSHLTFQEYLTARYLAENQGKAETNALIHTHLTDRRWREVFLLTASLLDDADAFVTLLHWDIDSIAATLPTLSRLLAWAQERTQAANTPVERRPAVQLAYIYLEIALAHESTRTRTRPREREQDRAEEQAQELAHAIDSTRALAFALAFALALGRAIDSARASAHAIDNVFAGASALALKSARASAHAIDSVSAITHATTPLTGFDYGLYYTWSYATLFANEPLDHTLQAWQAAIQAMPALIKGVTALAEKGRLTALAQQIVAIPLPAPTAKGQTWRHYADRLFAILRDKRDLGHEWEFTDEAINKLNDYFYANELLVECLKVAAVSDRQAILNGLLLPPQGLNGEAV